MKSLPSPAHLDHEACLICAKFNKNPDRLTNEQWSRIFRDFFKDPLLYVAVDIKKSMIMPLAETKILINILKIQVLALDLPSDLDQNDSNETHSFFFANHDLGIIFLSRRRFTLWPPLTLMPIPRSTYFRLLSSFDLVTLHYNYLVPYEPIEKFEPPPAKKLPRPLGRRSDIWKYLSLP
jgi:hypothetical protein